MKNNTLRAITIATLLVAGFDLSAVGTRGTIAAQYPRQSIPRPIPMPMPRPAPAPVERPAPTVQQQPSRPESQSAGSSSPDVQRQQQDRQAQREEQMQARQQQEQQKAVQRQQQEQARQAKQAQEAERKQQEQHAREVKQQQKLQEKQKKDQQKEKARQQKELAKLQKKQEKTSSASTHATNKTTTRSPGNFGASSVAPRHDSQTEVEPLNAKRANMPGINHNPLPPGDITKHSNGSFSIKTTDGRLYGVRSNGTIASVSSNGKSASFDNKGKLSAARTNNMSIHRGSHGGRIVVSHPTDGIKIVTTGKHNGYVERTIIRGNRTYLQRTVVLNNRIATRTYVVYNYRGVAFPHFVFPIFYSPAFYGWFLSPWVVPISYHWVWAGAPWYGGPNPYFVADVSYPNASSWLTDYYIGQTLSSAYEEQEEDLASQTADVNSSEEAGINAELDDFDSTRASTTTPITPDLKAAIADEVREQITAETSAASHPEDEGTSGELPSILSKGDYIFVVAEALDVTTDDQQGCALQAGDTLRLSGKSADDASLVELRVTSSRKNDCPAGVQVLLSLQDLQEMQNNFRTQIAAGLGTLHGSKGKDGLPTPSPAALLIPNQAAISDPGTMAGSEATSLLDSTARDADTLEQEMGGF